jgi:hypothetical protein
MEKIVLALLLTFSLGGTLRAQQGPEGTPYRINKVPVYVCSIHGKAMANHAAALQLLYSLMRANGKVIIFLDLDWGEGSTLQKDYGNFIGPKNLCKAAHQALIVRHEQPIGGTISLRME